MTTLGSRCRAVLSRLLDRLDDRISARATEAARRRGHTVTRIPGGRTHSYRNDALWDRARELQEFIDAEEAAAEGWDDECPAGDPGATVTGGATGGITNGATGGVAEQRTPEQPTPETVPWPGGAR